MTAIGRCPCCEGKTFYVRQEVQDKYRVSCSDQRCGCSGPARPTEKRAIAAWNRLAGPDVVIGRLRMHHDLRTLFIGNIPVGEVAPRYGGVWAWKINGGKWEDTDDEFSACAALIEAVRRAMGHYGQCLITTDSI